MKFLLSLAILFCMTANSFGEDIVVPVTGTGEKIFKVLKPNEIVEEVVSTKGEVPKEIEGLQWNRWTSKNFVVLALDDSYAKYLNEHLELVKTWTVVRWGLLDVDYSVPCKFICVDDPTLFEKLFKIKKTKVEIRRDDKGKIKETVIFLLANDAPSRCVPMPLTEVSLAEFGQKYDTEFGWWTYRGMTLLNGSLVQIRDSISYIKNPIENNSKIFFSKSLLELKKDQYEKLSDEDKSLFDSSAVLFCLMIRKEFGQDKFHNMMKDSVANPELCLSNRIGFKSYGEFDKTFKRYITDLAGDVSSNKTPDRYLQIYEPERN